MSVKIKHLLQIHNLKFGEMDSFVNVNSQQPALQSNEFWEIIWEKKEVFITNENI